MHAEPWGAGVAFATDYLQSFHSPSFVSAEVRVWLRLRIAFVCSVVCSKVLVCAFEVVCVGARGGIGGEWAGSGRTVKAPFVLRKC